MADEGIDFGDVATALAAIAVAVALDQGIKSLTQGKETSSPSEFTLKQSRPPAVRLVGGPSLVAGAFMLRESRGDELTFIQAMALGRAAFSGFYLNDDKLTLDGTGRVIGVSNGNDDGRYVDDPDPRVLVYTRAGLPTETAYAEAVSVYPELWSNDHRGDGIASMLFRFFAPKPKFFGQAFPAGQGMTAKAVMAGYFFDWRDDAQDIDDPMTWALNANPIIDLVNREVFLWGLDWDRCVAPVLDDLTFEADYCDEGVLNAAGETEPRFSCAGNYFDDMDRATVRQRILDTFGGWYSRDARGRLVIKAGRYEEPTVTITAEHIEGWSWPEGVPDEDRIWQLNPSFTHAASDFNQVQCDPWVLDATGTRTEDFDLVWCPSLRQARTLAKIKASELAQPSRWFKAGPMGFNLLGHRTIRIQNPAEPAMEDVAVEVKGVTVDPVGGGFVFRVIEHEAAAYSFNPATEEGAPIGEIVRIDRTPAPAPVIDSLTAFEEELTDGTRGARITIEAEGPLRNDISWSYRWRVAGDIAWQEFTDSEATGGGPVLTTGFVAMNADIEVQVQYATRSGASPWSATATVSTTDLAPAPDPASDLIVEAVANGTILVKWTASPSASQYASEVWRNTDDNFATAIKVQYAISAAAELMAWEDTGLTPATTYYYWVVATNRSGGVNGSSAPIGSASSEARPAAPVTPANLVVYPSDTGQLTAEWDASASASAFLSRLYMNTVDDFATAAIVNTQFSSPGQHLEASVSGLAIGTARYFWVVAASLYRESAPSASVSATPIDNLRLTEDGRVRVTEAGDVRILE